jgi:hypothetical protein
MKKQWLLQVEESFLLTGLGVLVFPAAPVTALAQFSLHTALALTLRWPTGEEETATGSVEEVSRPDSTTEAGSTEIRTLLLTHEAAALVPAGTEVWWNGEKIGESW